MADILCPVCGKANPEALEICQYCGALLKNRGTEPLPPIRPGEMPTAKKTSELESTLPGWLRNIRKGGTEESAETENAESPLPSFSTPEPPKPEAPKKNKAESPLDLLAGLSQTNEEEDDVPDWLASLKSNMPGGPVPSPEPIATESQPANTPADESPADWLAGLQDNTQTGQSVSEQPASFSAAEEPAASTSDETADWLSSLQAQDENSATPAQFTPAAPSFTEETPSAGNLPDWLNGLGDESSSQAAAPAAAEPAGSSAEISGSGDTPEWLAGLQNETAAAASEPAAATDPELASAGDLPDWMAGLGSGPEASMQPAPSPESPAENIPAPAEELPASAELSSGADLPDWLTAAIGDKPAEAPPADSGSAKAFSTGALEELGPLGGTGSLPDWMAGLSASEATPASGSAPSEPEQALPAQEQPAITAPVSNAAPEDDTFDWLTGAPEPGSKPLETEPEPVSLDLSTPEAATPPSVPAGESEQNLDSILSMDMPDWLSGFAPTESEPGKAGGRQASTPGADDISPANLPSWVQAMRPMEAVISGAEGDAEDQNIEKEGPLAGLRSVLPGQVDALGSHKPKAYSIKLQVDATQKAQAALLENLIASEAESHPISMSRRAVNIRPLRWAIAAVLFLMVLIPTLTGPTGLFPVPTVELNSELHLFQQKIDGLPKDATVLVVFDYQPGYAGEMEQAIGPVIANLVQKNARMVFVSTSPMGTLMSERAMAQHTSYKLNEQYINLGYLPGDAAGVQVFAERPHVLGNDYRIGNLWALIDPDNHINNFSDFEAILVLTDNPDTARTWIEQTGQARPPEKSMLMVLSAQAEPIIRPYYLSGQIQGVLSGLAGATAYQQTNPYWDSYAAGMMAAELLIIFGGVWALVGNLRARRASLHENDEEDEA